MDWSQPLVPFGAAWPDPVCAAGVLARMGAAVAAGGLAIAPRVGGRVQAALALALTGAALPAAATRAEQAAIVPLVAGELLVGLALGATVAAVLAAARWAGGVVGSLAGLSWADDFTPDGDPQSAGTAALAGWLAVGGFLVADGHLQVIAGFVDSVRAIPVGALAAGEAARADALVSVVVAAPTWALGLALALAGPALAAVLTFHVAAALCLRAVPLTPGAGLVQAAAALVLLAALAGNAEVWTSGLAAAARGPLERCLEPAAP